MAKRKKKSHKGGRRRRMGGIGSGFVKEALMTTFGTAAGIIGGRFLNSSIIPMTPTAATANAGLSISPTIAGAGEVALGALVAVKSKHPFIKGMGAGLAGNGAVFMLGSKGLGLLPASVGYGPDPMHRPARLQVSGFREVPKIGGGFPKPNVIGATRDRRRMANMYAGVYG